jgi:hypothetical protein
VAPTTTTTVPPTTTTVALKTMTSFVPARTSSSSSVSGPIVMRLLGVGMIASGATASTFFRRRVGR